MIYWQPNTTGSQSIKIRIRTVDASALPLTCSIVYGIGDTWATGSMTSSVTEYDTNDFLNLSASLSQPENTVATVEIYQVSASVQQHRKIYQGLITFLSESVNTHTAEPFISYTGSKTEYITY
jgi:hypothetical protein